MRSIIYYLAGRNFWFDMINLNAVSIFFNIQAVPNGVYIKSFRD